MRFVFLVIIFLLVVGGSTLLARYFHRESIEKELTSRSLTALETAGFGDVVVAYDHFHVELGGTVDRPADRAAVVEAIGEAVPAAQFHEEAGSLISIRP
ncbi:MAG: hypothetical protein AAF236_11810, partial [Verrucomicrobiota bacterium]